MADRGDAQAVADADSPAAEWPGFTFKGFDNVKLCTLLSLLRVGSPDAEFSRYLDLIAPASEPAEDGPVVFAVPPAEVTELAAVAALAEAQFKALAVTWAATEEFAGWSGSEVRDLLRELGDLAEAAALEGKWLFLWQSL